MVAATGLAGAAGGQSSAVRQGKAEAEMSKRSELERLQSLYLKAFVNSLKESGVTDETIQKAADAGTRALLDDFNARWPAKPVVEVQP